MKRLRCIRYAIEYRLRGFEFPLCWHMAEMTVLLLDDGISGGGAP